MNAPVVGALLACAVGVALAVCNDRMTRAVYQKKPTLLVSFYVVRQIVNIAYLLALYFLSAVLPWGMLPLLIGGAAGVTIPSMLLAARFARQIGAQRREGETADETNAEGKERESHG